MWNRTTDTKDVRFYSLDYVYYSPSHLLYIDGVILRVNSALELQTNECQA